MFALKASVILYITTHEALAASLRPNAARHNAPDDLVLPNPDHLTYEMIPGLFKHAPVRFSI